MKHNVGIFMSATFSNSLSFLKAQNQKRIKQKPNEIAGDLHLVQ
jgi:hypothetical protein